MRDEVVDEQLAYYRARAPEYDDWFFRRGRYDRGEEARRRWFDEAAQVRSALHDLPLDGADVLELAPGTGIWTAELAARARHLTVVDAAPEMLERCAERLGEAAARTEFVHADLFDWRPPPHRVWDVVLFCFWISHVPDDALPAFLDAVAAALRPAGRVFFLDGLHEPTSTAADHVLPAAGEATMVRRLDDGREYRIVKRYRGDNELREACRRADLDVTVVRTATYFQYGIGSRPA